MPRTARRLVFAGLLGMSLLTAAPSGAAEVPPAAGEPGWLSGLLLDLKSGMERAIILGGAFLYQNRHTVAGMTLGCAAGALVGAAGGTAGDLADAAPSAAIGCAAGAGAGAHLGRPLDEPME